MQTPSSKPKKGLYRLRRADPHERVSTGLRRVSFGAAVFFVAAAALIVIRSLYQIQIQNGATYRQYAAEQQLLDSTIQATRGEIYDTSGITPSQLRSRCRRLKMEHGLDMIMVDYLQLMSADGHVENRQNEVSEISRNLKSIAKELNVPLVALAQLSRAGAQRSDKRPILSDLRDSGAIEQDADVIMFLHREEYYDPNTEDKNIAEVIVAKQRNGPLGTVKLAWLGQYTRFASLQQGGAAQ